jgi:predicted amino acid dehydrogenase
MQDKIMDAAIVARDLGDERIPTSLVGMGAYTSIVTQNGTCMNDFEIPVTTGNAYTTALMGQGMIKAAETLHLDMAKSKVAIIGAAGNIGSCLTSLLSFFAGKLYLIGSDKRDSAVRMQKVINESLAAILVEIKNQLDTTGQADEVKLQGIAAGIYNSLFKPLIQQALETKNETSATILKMLCSGQIPSEIGERLNRLIIQENEGKNPWFCISELSVLKECDIVAIATNSPDAWLIGPSHINKGSIVCCASVPSNLSEAFKDHQDEYFVFDGGYARLPDGNMIDFIGMPKDGMAYGCLSETLLLAFDGRISSFAKGKISISQVMKTIELAEMYGFSLGEFRLGDAVHKGYSNVEI